MRLIRRPWKGCQFWDVPFTIPWKGCKFQKWGFPKWGYRIWFFGVFNMLHMLSYDHQGGLGGRVLTSLTSTSLTVRNMYTLRMLSYDHQGGCINVLDEYFLYVKEHGNTSKNGDLMRPMSMLHTKNQQVYKKKIRLGLLLDMASQCRLFAVCGFCVATSALALKRREEEKTGWVNIALIWFGWLKIIDF